VILSQTAVYALRAVIHLAESDGEDLVRVDDMAEALDVPRNYLSKILHTLARSGVLRSTRGPGGGFRLAIPAHELRLLDVVSNFDDMDDRRTCLLGRPQCSDTDPCAVHARWQDAAREVRSFFLETTVADLLDGKGAVSL
jgi:Rrf2 family protein